MLNFLVATALKMRKRDLIILLVVIAGVIFVLARQFLSTPEPNTHQVVNPKRAFEALEPGRSRHQDIMHELGQPARVYELESMTVYEYPSTTSYYTPDLLYARGDVLQLIELHYTPDQFRYTLERLSKNYGSPDKKLYMPFSPYMANYVYFYEDIGMAVFITQEHLAYKIQRFSPMSLEDYRIRWGADLLDVAPTPPKEVELHQH